jgi:hypothetical protein
VRLRPASPIALWCFAVVLCSGALQWCFAVVLCSGALQWCFAVVLCSGALQWCFAVVLRSGASQWSFIMYTFTKQMKLITLKQHNMIVCAIDQYSITIQQDISNECINSMLNNQ